MHTCAAAGQLVLERHPTQPSVGSHTCCAPHWSVPFTPQTALPEPMVVVVVPELPQARGTRTAAKTKPTP